MPALPGSALPGLAFDRAAALAGLEGDAELLAEIAGLFIANHAQSLSEIRAAIMRQDRHGPERAAHTLKGAVANFAAQSAVDAAWTLEQMGRAGELATSEKAWTTLDAEIARLIPALVVLVEEKVS